MVDYMSLQAALRAGGLIPGDIVAGSLRRCRVEGDHVGRRSGAYRLFDDEHPSCPWWNWKTGASGVWVSDDEPLSNEDYNRQKLLIKRIKQEREIERSRHWVDQREKLMQLWARGQPLTDSCPAGMYFRSRGLQVPRTDALRCVESLNYWHENTLSGAFPALLAAVTTPTGDLAAIHRTYLTDTGSKAPVPVVKKLTGTAASMVGASIKIGAPQPREHTCLGLGVAEGIETALAASALYGVPVWPCVSAHGLASFRLPDGVRYLYIFADNDSNGTGQKAAAKLARYAAAGAVVRILTPEVLGDWNDELMARSASI